ncbi:PorP/SprF family type IX secretion system membrane protein [Aquimarina spongiae]|uniref:Type IX secretion system membrane protein, PorP/SprF family n=1 Tax=Aquimarina spongiae TaxID=570521 RepID=A0A1M6FBY5_9FLAO|nr:PorP/SprF family type IX secretion system membrane protein [Aquimarina spongiae]SHI95185.1 type IX secretion system membrane protein, PorP/SprF family [Aquimarina spongiae]
MVRKLLVLIICFSLNMVRGQEEDATVFGVLPTDIPTHNLVKYNRFYFNPTFSLVRENKKSINAYNKTQWAGFNDNPQTYLINYTANFDEKTGVGIGLHQQNEGIYRYFGGIANFAYNLEFDRDMNFTFGLNLAFSQSGLKSNIDSATSIVLNNGVEVSDPTILNFENSSVFTLSPGVNFNYAEFDVGVSVSNLAAYNLSGSELLTDNMAFTGHVMYTTSLQRRSDKTIRGMAYANMLTSADEAESDSSLRYGGNVIVEFPELGWAQAGYNSFYGASLGIGGNITENVSVGYTYEMGLGDTSNFGSTHEVGLAYNFQKERPRRRRGGPKSSTQKAYEERDSEIRRLKKEILEQNKIIRELQDEQGTTQSNEERAMSELERSIAEAKEKEAKAARELELQREEEVKLLNKQAEEERLAAQRALERELDEQGDEEEGLASQKAIEKEVTVEESEEQRIAAEEAAREAEAAKEQAAEEARIAQEEAAREAEAAEQQAAEDARVAQEEAAREAEAAKQQAAEEARLAEQQRVEQEQEAARIAAEEQRKEEAARSLRELERTTSQVISDGDSDALRSQADLVRSNQFIPDPEKERLLADIDAKIAEKQADDIQELIAQTRSVISEGDLEALRSQLGIVQASGILPQADLDGLVGELNAKIAEKEAEATAAAEEERLRQEAADAARVAEEQRQAEEARNIRELIDQTRSILNEGDLNALRSQLDVVQGSTILPQADVDGLVAELNAKIAEKEAEAAQLAEQQRSIRELIDQTRTILNDGDVNALRSQLDVVQGSTILPQADVDGLVAELNAKIAEKEAEAAQLAEQQRSIRELIDQTRTILNEGDLNALRSQLDVVQGSTILPQADVDGLVGELNAKIAEKEAEAARLAEEERLRQEAAEAARLAEEQRQAEEARRVQELIDQTRTVIANGDLDALRSQLGIVQGSDILPQADVDGLVGELNAKIAEKEAEAARLAEEERLRQEAEAEAAAAAAEEERQRQEAAAATQENEEGLDEIKKELDDNTRISSKLFARRDSLLTTSLNVDKRGFNKLLESLVSMNDDAEEAKDSDPTSSKRLSANNRFIKFADATRPEAQYATKYIPGYPEGYYLIGNVFKGGTYAQKFTETLSDLGFNNSKIILNPENQFQYVAIEYYEDKDEAAEKYLNSIDNRYYGDMWILHIAKSRVASYKKLLQETRLITDTVKDDTVLTESLSYIGGHNIENGYYLITNIFKRENYFERGMEKLRSQGLEPQFFRNPKDNYIYVYLKRFDDLDSAKQSLFSNVEGSFSGDLYILKIQ